MEQTRGQQRPGIQVVIGRQAQPRNTQIGTGLGVTDAFTLTANLRTLLRDRGTTPTAHAATLRYADGEQKSVLLTLTVPGNFRRSTANCSFLTLLINFPKKKTRNTPFEHQNKLKLVTQVGLGYPVD